MQSRRTRIVARLCALTLGAAFFLNGCDPTLRTTVENGIINSANAALGSFFQAILQLVNEQNAAENQNDNV